MGRATTSVRVDGLSELLARLKALPPEIVSKRGGLVRSALAASARMVKQEVIKNAPTSQGKPTSGRLRRNVIMIRTKNPQKWGVNEEYLITVRRGPRRKKASEARTRQLAKKGISRREDPRDAYYARFLEMGTEQMRARAFIGMSFEARKRDALELFKVRLSSGIKRTVRKLGGR